jgi:hypothetical protein
MSRTLKINTITFTKEDEKYRRTRDFLEGRRLKAYTENGKRGKRLTPSGARSILLKNNINRAAKKQLRSLIKNELRNYDKTD